MHVRPSAGTRGAQLLIDDPTGFRAVLVPATVEIREDLDGELPRFRAIRQSTGWPYRTTMSICGLWRRRAGPAGHHT